MLKKVLIVVLYLLVIIAIRVILGTIGMEAENSRFVLGVLCCILPAVIFFAFKKEKK